MSKRMNAWKAYCNKEHLGYYSDEVAGAIAYSKRAKELFGEFAKLNDAEGIEIRLGSNIIRTRK